MSAMVFFLVYNLCAPFGGSEKTELLYPAIVCSVDETEHKVGAVGIRTKGERYEWSKTAIEIHRDLSDNEQFLKKLLNSQNPREQELGLVFLSPFIWEGYASFVPRHRLKMEACVERRKYVKLVETKLWCSKDWNVRVGCLLFYFGFPDLLNEHIFTRVFDFEQEWGKPDDEQKDDANKYDLGYLVVRSLKSREESSLSLVAFMVYCQSKPRQAIDYAVGRLQGRQMWLYGIQNTRAKWYLSREAWTRIKKDTDRRLLGGSIGVSIANLAFSLDGFLRLDCLEEEFQFPEDVLRIVLGDKDASREFREVLSEHEYWFKLRGIDTDWSKEGADGVIRALRDLFFMQKEVPTRSAEKCSASR